MIVKDIAVSSIQFKENIRQKGIDFELANLVQNIKDYGLLQPIGVKELSDDDYLILWGNRRLKACRELGWKTIPAVIFLKKEQEMSEEEFFVINSIENLQRKPNTLFELGRICKILRKTKSVDTIATMLSIPKRRVETALMEIDRIPAKWQKKIRIMDGDTHKGGDISMSSATKVTQLRGLTDDDKDKLLEHISQNDESTRGVELIGSIIRSGEKSIKKAIKISKRYQPLCVKIYIDKEKFQKAIGDYSVVDFIIETINKIEPGLAIKSITRLSGTKLKKDK